MGLRRPGDKSVDFLAPHERFSFEVFATLQYSLSSAVLYVIGCYVARGFVVATRVVVANEASDLLPYVVGILPYDEGEPLLARPMIALNLAVGLGMIRRGEDMPQSLCFQIFAEWL